MKSLKRDLRRMVEAPLQQPLWLFIQDGVIPYGCPELLAELAGRGNQPRNGVTAFLDRHAATLDIAHGHLAYVLRWQRHGGLAGARWPVERERPEVVAGAATRGCH